MKTQVKLRSTGRMGHWLNLEGKEKVLKFYVSITGKMLMLLTEMDNKGRETGLKGR